MGCTWVMILPWMSPLMTTAAAATRVTQEPNFAANR